MGHFQLGGQTYLAYKDQLIRWLEVAYLLLGAYSGKIMKHLKHYSIRSEAPKQLSTDSGINLVSREMAVFLNGWGITTCISSTQYSQSNGWDEAAMKTAG